MLLSLRMLQSALSANDYEYVDQAVHTAGDTVTHYFQLIDVSKDRNCQPSGRPYMPASGATLTISLLNIDDAKVITNRICTQPYATNPSIWAVNLTAADTISGTCRAQIALTQSSIVTRGHKEAAVLINSVDP